MTRDELLNAVDRRVSVMRDTLGTLDDEIAVGITSLFETWIPGQYYETGLRLQYNGKLYRVVQAHRSQADWTPDAVPALYAEVSNPSEEWPEWRQPAGAQDAYNQGDKVSYNEKYWVSNVDGNVWEPGVYGWDEA